MSARGIGNDHTVVLYGGNNNWFAAYAYWYFALYGHADVRLLDGGRKKWELDGRELVAEVPDRPATSYVAQELDGSIRAMRDEVLASLGQRNLVDVRSPDEFSGRLLAPAHLPQEQSQRAGHIPTARNIPWSKAARDDGTFRDDDELRDLYADEGVDFEPGHDRLLPHRGAVRAHLVRPARDPRAAEREELRRLVDRVGLAGRRPHRARRGARGPRVSCAAPEGGHALAADLVRRLAGRAPSRSSRAACSGPGSRCVRTSGCSAAPASSPPSCRPGDDGRFRFFAAPGEWTLRTLAPKSAPFDTTVTAVQGQIAEVVIDLPVA